MASAEAAVVILVVWALGPGASRLRSLGIPVPHVHLPYPLQVLIFVAASVFLVGEVILLIFAIATISNEQLHNRFLHLMLLWPYVLIVGYVIAMTRALPKRYLSEGNHRRSDGANVRQPDRAVSVQVRDDQNAVTQEEWRAALGLVIKRLESAQIDHEVLQMTINQLKSLEQQSNE